MGYFTEGYEQGIKIQNGELSSENFNEGLKNLLKNNTYGECVEWYNGFYKGMLDYELKALETAFMKLKEESKK